MQRTGVVHSPSFFYPSLPFYLLPHSLHVLHFHAYYTINGGTLGGLLAVRPSWAVGPGIFGGSWFRVRVSIGGSIRVSFSVHLGLGLGVGLGFGLGPVLDISCCLS